MEDQQCMIMATLQIKENHSLYIVDNDPAVYNTTELIPVSRPVLCLSALPPPPWPSTPVMATTLLLALHYLLFGEKIGCTCLNYSS
jgi:hypothetical protein